MHGQIFPYLLRTPQVTTFDEVWCAAISYLPLEKCLAYLVTVMDWHRRAVPAWEISVS